MLASGCNENQYSKGKKKVVISVHFITQSSLLLGIPPTFYLSIYYEIVSLHFLWMRCEVFLSRIAFMRSFSQKIFHEMFLPIIIWVFSLRNNSKFFPQQQNAMGSLRNIGLGVGELGRSGTGTGSGWQVSQFWGTSSAFRWVPTGSAVPRFRVRRLRARRFEGFGDRWVKVLFPRFGRNPF